jgi:hypothetical protein
MSTVQPSQFGGGVAVLAKRPMRLKATAYGPLRCIPVTWLELGQRES